MKMYGSNVGDTFIGTKKIDNMFTYDGDDLIATNGGADIIRTGLGNDMITGFSFDLNNVFRSAYRNADIDGGSNVGDHDIMLVEMKAARRTSHVDDIFDVMKAKGIEEFIYNFATASAKQQLFGTKNAETIVVQAGDARVDMGDGNDYLYTAAGDDIVKGGKGSDFIHAGEGHNTATGGAGIDYFHFQITDTYQYTDITDFKAGEDKILISVDFAQVNLLFGEIREGTWEDIDKPLPTRFYGDGHYGVGPALNEYVSYNHGREFDIDNFVTDDGDLLQFNAWARYEQDTGSIFAMHFEEQSWGIEIEQVLVAHVKPGTDIDVSDFLFRIV